jgi:endonuclease YncB( thermonuclease family)
MYSIGNGPQFRQWFDVPSSGCVPLLGAVTYRAEMMSRVCLFLLIGFCTVIAARAATHIIEGRIVGITDDDTITLLDADHRQHKIRLDGIDAPESKQPYGNVSKRHLSDLAFNREAVAECHKIDRYKRSVCRVLVDGVDVCLEQIQAGMAWHFKRYAKSSHSYLASSTRTPR